MADARPFVWYELLTTDPQGAQAFYTHVLGWGTQPFGGGDNPYTMWTVGGQPIGGVMQMPPGAEAPPNWLGYVDVEDVDATARRAVELGGQTHVEPRDIPDVGRFAVLADPQGAYFAIYKSSNPMPQPAGEPREGTVAWHELATSDGAAAWRFYSELFGWRQAGSHDMGGDWMYDMWGYGEAPAGAVYTKTAEMPGPPAWTFYVRVRDLDAHVARVTERGGQVINGPMEVPGGDRIAICTDPQGAVFALHERKEPAA